MLIGAALSRGSLAFGFRSSRREVSNFVQSTQYTTAAGVQAQVGIMQMAEQALSEVDSITCDEAFARKSDGDLVFVDVRDIREVEQSDTIEGSHHAPRGMIEFWFDPTSPYHREIYAAEDKTYVLFCNGNPRSALCAKALKDMGISNVAQLTGGMPAWREAGGPTVEKKRK
jgi:rhodanese-related sulfurtransferase